MSHNVFEGLPLLLDGQTMMKLVLGCSKSHFERMKARKMLPEPLRLGRAYRWRKDHIMKWLENGMPSEAEFSRIAAK